MSAAPTRPLLAAGAVALFFLSFLMSAGSNALPQVFLQRHAPQDKAMLLSVALLASTAAATLGVLLSRRMRLRPPALLACLASAALLAQWLLATASVPGFIALLVLLQFVVNFLVDQVDHAAVARSGALLAFNDTAGNGARLLGMLVAPAWFTLLAGQDAVERMGVALVSLAALAGAWRLLRLAPGHSSAPAGDAHDRGRAQPEDFLLFGFAVAVYAGMYLLAANAIYLLQDLFGVPDAEARGGVLIVTVFAAAIVANGIAGAVATGAARSRRAAALLAPAMALAVAALAPLAGLRPSYGVCLLASAAVGAGYGFFLRELRTHASAAARAGRGVVLGWFNNMANVSALLAFGLMLLASRVAPAGGYYVAVLGAVLALQVAGAALFLVGMRPLAVPPSPSGRGPG